MQSAPPLRGDKEKDMKKQHRRFRWAFAVATLAAFAAGCGSGLLDTEDKALPNSEVQMTLAKTLDGTPDTQNTVNLTVKLFNGQFEPDFVALAKEEGEEGNDISKFFAVEPAESIKDCVVKSGSYTTVEGGADLNAGIYVMPTVTVVAKLTYTVGKVSNGPVRITLKEDALKIKASRTVIAGTYAFKEPTDDILLPDANAMKAAIALKDDYKDKLFATGRVSLINPTSAPISVKDELGSGTAGDTSIKILAAANIPAQKGELPLVIVSDDTTNGYYTGEVSFNLTHSAINGGNAVSFTYNDASCFWVPYYAEDYEAENASVDWTTGTPGRYDPILVAVDGNNFLTVTDYEVRIETSNATGGSNNNGTTLTGPALGVPAGTDFKLSFDVKLGNCSDVNSADRHSSFCVKAADNTTNILLLEATGPRKDTWYINESKEETSLPGTCAISSALGYNKLSNLTWYTILLERTGSKTYLTIKQTDGETPIISHQEVSASPTGGLGKMSFDTNRYYANFAIDNVFAYLSE